jgi:hypothetical protein
MKKFNDENGIMSNKQKILIICFSDLVRDPRVCRQILSLNGLYDIVAAGYVNPNVENVDFIQLDKNSNKNIMLNLIKFIQIKLGLYDSYYWSKAEHIDAYQKLKSIDYDLILANDLDALPLAVRLAKEKNIKLIYDAHEYSPREFENSLKWRLLWQRYKYNLCKKYLPQVNAMTTVCDGIAKEYYREFGVDKPNVITNAPFYN